MIIVEGPDGAGKTNLCKRMLDVFDLELMPKAVTSAETRSIVPIGKYVEDELGKGFGMRLYDRFALISSPMYLSLPEPTFVHPMTDLEWLRAQWELFARIDPVIIFCMPPLEVVKENLRNDPETPDFVKNRIDIIYYSYLAFMARSWNGRDFSSAWLVWDYTAEELPWHRVDALMRWTKARVEKGRSYKRGR